MTNETLITEGKRKPDLYIYTKRQDGRNGKIGSRIGAGWFHGDQTGINIFLDVQPIPYNGSIELVGLPPKDFK